MRQVDSFFSPTADRTLYHYTGIGGLMGMVDSRAVWASHIYYLNDSKEILHACDVLSSLLSKKETAGDNAEGEFIRQFREWLESFRRNPFHILVFSLSEGRSQSTRKFRCVSGMPHNKSLVRSFRQAQARRLRLRHSGGVR